MTESVDHRTRWRAAMMNNYGVPAVELVRGEGAQVWDADGRRYLDMFGGIAVNALGHAHPAVVEAVSTQIATLAHVTNFFATGPMLGLAERLLDLLGATDSGRVLFTNSGAEAVEAALKIARRTGRPNVVSTEGAFHGRTLGALSITGQPAKRTPFEPLLPGVGFVPFGDVAALEAAVDADTAAVFIEPILGEFGVVVPPTGYLQAAREICTRHGALLVVDEIQTGMGRTGSWFLHQAEGVTPDVVTVAKALGGGLPIGAVVGIGAAGDLLEPGQHGSTFGGNPVACAAGLAVIDTITADGLVQRAGTLGKEITAAIEALEHPLVDHVRGAGLLLGIVLREPCGAEVASAGRDAGLLLNPAVPNAIRLAPALVITDDQVGEFLAALPSVLDAAGGGS